LELVLTPVIGLWILYAVAASGLFFLVTRAKPTTLGNAALMALLGQQVWTTGSAVLREMAINDPVLYGQATTLWIPSLLVWSPVVWLAGPLLLGEGRHAKLLRTVGVAGALPSVALLVAFFAAPDLVLDISGFTTAAAAALFLVFSGFAFTVGVLAHEALTTKLPVRRGQFALLAAAFSVEGAYHAAQNTAKVLNGGDFFGAEQATPLLAGLSILPFVGFLLIGGYAVRTAMAAKDPEHRKWARILAGFIGAAALTGVLASGLTVSNEYTDPAGAIHAAWDLAGLAFIVYAGMRFQLFSLERRAKQSVAVTAAVVIGFVAFNSVQELAEQSLADVPVLGFFLNVLEGMVGASASGVFAALFVGIISIPVGKGGLFVANKLFPHVVPTEDYEAQRKREIYQAALEGAFADGIETPKEVASLTRLRAALGITDAEHEAMEAEIRVRIDKPLAPR
jgi:hypothetical protein